jgi:adenine-specific DNA-methyltransferase
MQLNKEDGGNRKFILVEMEDYAETITAERVKRVMQGVPESKNFKEGLGGAFDFYELGKPLFHSDGMLNEEVEEQKIRDYIWFTETRSTQLPELAPAQTNAEKHLLGVHEGCGLYFYYLPNEETILNLAFLSQIQTKAESYIIYADELLLTQDQLRQLNIVFKKIPRDITRL